MAQIHVLDSATIDKIAAGEVVERPASVVKELVENAIDAGATAITVEIKDGGIEFIRVTDNGCGMESNQLRKAFLRHATSKIENAEDLNGISSLGFRGEALSSISAVAKVEVITKTADSLTGTRMILEGGREVAFEEIGAPDGTTFIMRNLFFNTPVRRKFLKQPATEGSYIADLMEHLALSRPDISFKLVQGTQMRFHTSGNGDLREVVYRIYGRETAGALVPIHTEQEGIRIQGFLGEPVQVRSNRNYEICFLNGRFIRSSVICRAVEEGYKEYLMQHKFPFCVLHIQMDPYRVDVNVHPTKMDVRFSQPLAFSAYLSDAVKQTLKRNEMIPEALLSTDKELKEQRKQEKQEREQTKAPEAFELNRSFAYRVMEDTKYKSSVTKPSGNFQNPIWDRIRQGNRTEAAKPVNTQSNPEKKEEVQATNAVNANKMEEIFFTETSELPVKEIVPVEPKGVDVVAENREPEGKTTQEEIKQEAVGTQLNLFDDKILKQENRRFFRVIGQVFDTYWLIEYENQLLMIDQHAAHEKINYERLMKQFHEKNVISQRLLPPVILSLTAREEEVLREYLETFLALGFEIDHFGGNEYSLRSVPVDLYGCSEKHMFIEVLDQLSDGGNFGGIRVIEEKIASMSCKAAIKGNQHVSAREAEVLIDELLGLENPYNCPHGRPTIISMSKSEMEKKFKRIV